MARYQAGVTYKGLKNVSPQPYANSMFRLSPGEAVIVAAPLADKVFVNAGIRIDYLDEDLTRRIVERGSPDPEDAFDPVVVDALIATEEGVASQSPPASEVSDDGTLGMSSEIENDDDNAPNETATVELDGNEESIVLEEGIPVEQATTPETSTENFMSATDVSLETSINEQPEHLDSETYSESESPEPTDETAAKKAQSTTKKYGNARERRKPKMNER